MPVLAPSSTPATARVIIGDALTFHLNRLSPGETAGADVLDVCLSALNNIADELNGVKSFLYREILTASDAAISSASALLGTDWTTLVSGEAILGATYASSGLDVPMLPLTMQQYHEYADKATTGEPLYYAHDGAATIYFGPVPNGKTITLRTKQSASEFADLDTGYSLPKGWRSGLAALLAEKLAPTMNAALLAACKRDASAARLRMAAQSANPAIVGGQRRSGYNILTG